MGNSSIDDLIKLLSKIPGIGPKSAERITYFFLQATKDYVNNLTETISNVKLKIKPCSICGNYSEQDLCSICSSDARDRTKICVVEEPKDLLTLEKLKIYNGLYHVLFGVISPINGVGPNDLNIQSLVERIKKAQPRIEEVIIATNPTPEGDTTGIYISRLVKDHAQVTRIAFGIPVGANIDYTDLISLAHSFKDRKPVE